MPVTPAMIKGPLSIAPMMKCSTPQMRYVWRQLCKSCLLYTEMQTAAALLAPGGRNKLDFLPCERPLALQVAGDSPAALAHCTQLAQQAGYDEINLNLGCPSNRATDGCFGASLMKHPTQAAACVEAMCKASSIPVSVKLRTGVDHLDSMAYLVHLTRALIAAGATKIIVHARKAWLKGLSAKQNRSVPPLQYERVYELKQYFPDTQIILNGGLRDLAAIRAALTHIDGVMLGRAVYEDPMFLGILAQHFYGEPGEISRQDLFQRALHYAELKWQDDEPFRHTGRHLLNLYKGMRGSRNYRRQLSLALTKHQAPPSFAQLQPFLPAA